MGPVVLLVILLPFLLIVIGEGQLPSDPETEWFLVFATLDCTVASLVCVRILRSSIRGPNAAAGVSAAAVFVTAEAVALLPSILSVVEEGVMVIIVVLTALCMSPLLAILYLPLAWPVAWVLVSILRRICPEGSTVLSERGGL
jgi:FtsH-binding integral membrane protein